MIAVINKIPPKNQKKLEEKSKELYGKEFKDLNQDQRLDVLTETHIPDKCPHGLNENVCNKCAYGDF
jgi:hypothetical protein